MLFLSHFAGLKFMLYSILRTLLFRLSAETSHNVALESLSFSHQCGLSKLLFANSMPDHSVEVMGLRFPNPIGLAAGLDKNGNYIDALTSLGFGFIEIGTVTPKAQIGNPKPRLFRLKPEQAIINRMGFNNLGVDYLVSQVMKSQYEGILGINIGKNKTTAEEDALADYLYCLRKVYEHADYITVNVSSPNTPGLRNLQFGDLFKALLEGLKKEQLALQSSYGVYRPIAVKVAPDMDEKEARWMASALVEAGIDAVIATNTTVQREMISTSPYRSEQGGLSGAPLREASTQLVGWLADALKNQLPIIGVGGIMDAKSASEKVEQGADLLQVYSGFIYHGPSILQSALDGYLDGEALKNTRLF